MQATKDFAISVADQDRAEHDAQNQQPERLKPIKKT
jgi:hypothetical protein